jgi:hypothetical protein
MDELENITTEQDTGSQDNIQTDDISDNQEIEEETIETSEQERVESAQEEIKLPEKIKLGEKEYTPAELEEITKKVEEQAKANEYQPRELNIIEQEYSREEQNFNADTVSLYKKYVALGDDITDENGNVTYTAEQLFQHGLQTGQWDYFIQTLNPNDAVNFQNERIKIASHYMDKLGKLEQEKQYISKTEGKKQDLGRWEGYIEQNFKDKPAETHFLNKLKQGFDFDEQGAKNVMQWFREAIELEKNKADLGAENNNAKQAIMNSTFTGNNQGHPDSIPRSWDSIVKKMDGKGGQEWYKHNLNKIIQMRKQGLIK